MLILRDIQFGDEAVLTKTVDVEENETTLQDLLALVRDGAEVLLTEGDTPLARLVPDAKSDKPRVFDLHPGAIWMSDDFDDPLPDEFWLGE